MKVKDLVKEAIEELNDEERERMVDEIKERLREIREAKKILAKLETQYMELLEEDIEDAHNILSE
ncbi:MAG: hypothetical protein KAT70_09285 [Thermoplasmata archaeon]|nr:hypothetical protein [Thermoplasmata archaeon]